MPRAKGRHEVSRRRSKRASDGQWRRRRRRDVRWRRDWIMNDETTSRGEDSPPRNATATAAAAATKFSLAKTHRQQPARLESEVRGTDGPTAEQGRAQRAQRTQRVKWTHRIHSPPLRVAEITVWPRHPEPDGNLKSDRTLSLRQSHHDRHTGARISRRMPRYRPRQSDH